MYWCKFPVLLVLSIWDTTFSTPWAHMEGTATFYLCYHWVSSLDIALSAQALCTGGVLGLFWVFWSQSTFLVFRKHFPLKVWFWSVEDVCLPFYLFCSYSWLWLLYVLITWFCLITPRWLLGLCSLWYFNFVLWHCLDPVRTTTEIFLEAWQ